MVAIIKYFLGFFSLCSVLSEHLATGQNIGSQDAAPQNIRLQEEIIKDSQNDDGNTFMRFDLERNWEKHNLHMDDVLMDRFPEMQGLLVDSAITSPIYPDFLDAPNSWFCYTMKLIVGTAVSGTQDQTFNVLVDTGSSNLALAGKGCCYSLDSMYDINASSTSLNLHSKVSVTYAKGAWSGSLVQDNVTLAGNKKLAARANFAVIEKENNFLIGNSFHGILGLAYQTLARKGTVPYFDELVYKTGISNEFSIELCHDHGQLFLGGHDPKFYIGDLLYTPIILEKYYQVQLLRWKVGNVSIKLPRSKQIETVIDSGTTKLSLPNAIFQSVMKEIRLQSDLLFLSPNSCFPTRTIERHSFPTLILEFPSVDSKHVIRIPILPENYWRKVSSSYSCFSISPTGGNGIILGDVFMQGLFIVHDRARSRIGFAKSSRCDAASPSLTNYTLLLSDLCRSGIGENLCGGSCEKCMSYSSTWCQSGSAKFVSEDNDVMELGTTHGFCWHGTIFGLTQKTKRNVVLPNGIKGDVYVTCNDSVSYYSQCTLRPVTFLTGWVVIAVSACVCVCLMIYIATLYLRRKPEDHSSHHLGSAEMLDETTLLDGSSTPSPSQNRNSKFYGTL